MTLLKTLFGTDGSIEKRKFSWISLNSLSQLDEILINSHQKPQLIFKHSTRCGISRMVKRQFEVENSFLDETAHIYYLDLLKHRDISNQIASSFKVYHESPQLLIIKNGEVIKHASHGSINELDLNELL